MPVPDPGRGQVKKGFAWAIARDDRPWGGTGPPAVVFHYAPGRGASHPKALLAGYSGILQCDGYAAYKTLAAAGGGAITLAFCWSHARREFIELARGKTAPIATEALQRIAALYAIEAAVRGQPSEIRRAVRQAKSRALVEDLFAWFKVAVCPIRGRRGLRVAAFLRKVLALDVIVTTPEAHDREAATVQGLTHLIARVSSRWNLCRHA